MAEKSALEVLKESIAKLKEQFTPLMGAETDKFIQIACNYVEQKWDKLQKATTVSIFAELMKAAQMKLYLDGNEAALAPYAGTAKLMVMYKGLLKLVRNSGELGSINSDVVYEGDNFDFFVDEKGEHIMHRRGKERKVPTHVYCIARIKGSEFPYIEVMTKEEVEDCKKQSAAVKNKIADNPWEGAFVDEMWKKTVIRRISKRLPMSTDLNMAINNDDIEEIVAEPAPAAEQKTQSSALEQAVGAAPAKTVEQEKQQIKDVQNTFSQNVEGVLVHISGKDYPNPNDASKPARRRFSVKIGEIFYGTWDAEMFKRIEDLYNKKVVVNVKFVTQLNSKKQPYNEILDVTEKVAEEEIPI